MRIEPFILSLLLLVSLLTQPEPAAGSSTGYTATGQQGLWLGKEGPLPPDLRAGDVIRWQGVSASAYGEGSVSVGIRLETTKGFSLYRDKVSFSSPSGLFLSQVVGPDTRQLIDPVTGKKTEVWQDGEFFLLFKGLSPFAADTFPIEVTFVGCTELICLTRHTSNITLPIHPASLPLPKIFEQIRKPEPFAIASPANDTAGNGPAPGKTPDPEKDKQALAPEQSIGEALATGVRAGQFSLLFMLIIAFIGGIMTNLTPCVYPLIPITIRVLAGQGQRPWSGSLAYSAGIVVAYSALGIFAALTGSMFGRIMASNASNLAFASVMAVLGVTMLGFGNFNTLQNLGHRFSSGTRGIRHAFFMGAGAGLVASPCTGPILAALLTYASTGQDPARTSALMLAYSLGFGMPYVLLGGAAARLAAIKVPPTAQMAIKLVFAAIMFALSLHYLKVPAYGLFRSLASLWPVIGIIAAGSGLGAALFLLGHRSLRNKGGILLFPSVLLGLSFFSAAQILSGPASESHRTELYWFSEEAQALKIAKKEQRPVLIDFWAEWCEACKKMDARTFADPRIIRLLSDQSWVLLRLDLTEANDQNDRIQESYQVAGLPTLRLFYPEGREGPRLSLSLSGYTSPEALIRAIEKIQAERK